TPDAWLDVVRGEQVTHAMLVPTMLARVVERLDGKPAGCPSLRSLAYGGARVPITVLDRAVVAFARAGFVTPYGLPGAKRARAGAPYSRGGKNIAPAEIEDVFLPHPAVLDVAVVGLPDEEWGQRLAAAVVLRPGSGVDGEDLRAFAFEHLRSSKTPDVIALRP